MNYKDTLLDFSKITYLPPKIKQSKDGKIDITFKIPVTDLIAKQAEHSFLMGIKAYHNFVLSLSDSDSQTTENANAKLLAQFTEWGFKI